MDNVDMTLLACDVPRGLGALNHQEWLVETCDGYIMEGNKMMLRTDAE
jgi:hypothetical protein